MAEPEYVVFVRVPIPRGDFVDPPPVIWDSTKDDEALWRILSGAAQTEIDWNQVAARFDVPVAFLLQQVAYLTERHASQVRAQVRKATAAAKGSSAPSPIPGADSGPINPRTASALSLRRDSPMPRHDGSGAGTPLHASARPLISRNASANTALRESGTASPRTGKVTGRVEPAGRRRLSSLPITSSKSSENAQSRPQPEAQPERERTPSPGPAESSSTTSSSDESSPAQSRIIRRPPRYQQQETETPYNDPDDDGEESEPAFKPYRETSNPASNQTSAQDLASTLRGDGRTSSRRGQRSQRSIGKEPAHASQTSDSSTGSPALVQRPGKKSREPGPLSPRRTAELAGRSPSGNGKGISREGSDGTPSMGSSFSDLDDASVTQSALEEALASHMNRGASSRFSISQAFRSRYTPNPGQ